MSFLFDSVDVLEMVTPFLCLKMSIDNIEMPQKYGLILTYKLYT